MLFNSFSQAAYWSTMRDLIFLLITASLTLSFFVFFDEIQLWQPLSKWPSNQKKLKTIIAVFLGLYVIYVAIVLTTEYFKRKKIVETREMSKRNSGSLNEFTVMQDVLISVVPNALLTAADIAVSTTKVEGNLKRGSAFKRMSIAVSNVLGTGHDNGQQLKINLFFKILRGLLQKCSWKIQRTTRMTSLSCTIEFTMENIWEVEQERLDPSPHMERGEVCSFTHFELWSSKF